MSIAHDLAERIRAIKYENLPADAVPLAQAALLDAVGCAFLGASEEMSHIVERCRVLPVRTDPAHCSVAVTERIHWMR